MNFLHKSTYRTLHSTLSFKFDIDIDSITIYSISISDN
jgi:hypothetical protein